METKQRDWYYLLPDGINTAENMKEGRDKLSKQTGRVYSSSTFRNLVRKGVIKKLNRNTNSIITLSNAEEIQQRGSKGVLTQLKTEARTEAEKRAGSLEKLKTKDLIVSSYIYHKIRMNKHYYKASEEERLKTEKAIRWNRAEALTHIVSEERANLLQIKQLSISESDILFELEYSRLLKEYITSQLNENPIFEPALSLLSKQGHLTDYTELDRIKSDRESQYELKIKLNEEKRNPKASIGKSPEEIRLEQMQNKSFISDIDLKLQNCYKREAELREEYFTEYNRVREESNRPENICALIFDADDLTEAISRLRKTRLENLVKITNRIYNKYYEKKITDNRKLQKRMKYKPKQELSLPDKKELIKIGKADGLKNPEIARQLNISLRTVERYSK